MKILSGLVASVSIELFFYHETHNSIQAVALSDEEFAKFKCRGGSFYQYGNADGGHTVTEINEYASTDNNYQGWMNVNYSLNVIDYDSQSPPAFEKFDFRSTLRLLSGYGSPLYENRACM